MKGVDRKLIRLKVFKNPVPGLLETYWAYITQSNRSMLFTEIIAVYSENHTKRTNTLRGKTAELSVVKLVAHTVTTEFEKVKRRL
jgi:hypothetical protein